jgi:hypothetical protein
MVEVVYSWKDCFNIDLKSNKLVWWNEDYICIDEERKEVK